MLGFETLTTILMLALAVGMRKCGVAWCRLAERTLARIAQRRGLAVVLVGFLSFGGSAAVMLSLINAGVVWLLVLLG